MVVATVFVTTAGAAAAGAAAAGAAAAATSTPPPGPSCLPPAYTASATSSLVTLDVVHSGTALDLANVDVAPVAASSALSSTPSQRPQSAAKATNLDVSLVNGLVRLDNELVSASQNAPRDHPRPATKTLFSLVPNEVLDTAVATASAQARSVPGPPTAGLTVADADSQLLNATAINGTSLGTYLVGLENAEGGVVKSQADVALVPAYSASGGTLRSPEVRSQALTQLTGVTLLAGTAHAITVNVLAPPSLTASADGVAGSASVTYTEPILQILQGNRVVGQLDANTPSRSLTETDGQLSVSLSLGVLSHVTKSASGTAAAGKAYLLNVDVTVGAITVADLTIAPQTASVQLSDDFGYCR